MSNKQNKSNFKKTLYFLLDSISIRGCNRIVKAKSKFVKFLWIFYLIFTSLFLIISIRRLISEYLTYSVNIQTYVDMDSPSEFPAITFCNHQPFSENAYKLWRQNIVISPTKFNELLRQSASVFLKQSQLNNKPFPFEAALYAFVFDSVKMYYQNLDWPYPKEIGHKRNQSIYMCLLRYSGENLVIGGHGCHDHMIKVSDRSHPQHFNCHTVKIQKPYTKIVQELGLIVWLGPKENYDIGFRQAFLLDLFEQAHGLRVAIHEPDQLANLESQGIQIEPGQLNELNFDAIKSIRVKSPTKPCTQNPIKSYIDLDSSYSYAFELCLNSQLQKLIINQCQCIYAYLPRIKIPSAKLPYCGRIVNAINKTLNNFDIIQRKGCVHKILSQSAVLKKQFEDNGLCLRRCNSIDYVSTVSVTSWRSTQWQLHWSRETFAALDNMDSHSNQMIVFQKYFESKNLSTTFVNDRNNQDNLTETYGFSDRYTYVLVKRKNNDTIVKAETLVLTMNALFSRIGGLCSLYIGMTFAVLIEIIEFIYTLALTRNQIVNQSSNKNPNFEIKVNSFISNDVAVVETNDLLNNDLSKLSKPIEINN